MKSKNRLAQKKRQLPVENEAHNRILSMTVLEKGALGDSSRDSCTHACLLAKE
jgi:hypothetical protein